VSPVFVDTSALLALLVVNDVSHAAARAGFERLHDREAALTDDLHERALDLVLERGQAAFSLVDAASLLTIRDRGIHEVFAFDGHFEVEGLTPV